MRLRVSGREAVASGLLTALVGFVGVATAQQPLGAPPARPPAIATERLAPLNPWNVTGLPRGAPTAPRGVWQATDSARLSPLLDAIPAAPASPTAVALLRTLLASPAEPPAGDSRAAARNRIEALARLGAANEVIELSVGPMREDLGAAVFAAQAELALGRMANACRRIATIVADEAPPFVLRMRAVCFAVNGDADSASLAMEVAATKGAADAWLSSALRSVAGQTPSGPRAQAAQARYDTSINAAVSLAAGLAPPADVNLAGASQFALLAIANAEQAPPAVRAQALSRLARLNRISPDLARAALDAAVEPRARSQPAWVGLARAMQVAADAPTQANLLRAAIDQSASAADAAAIHRMYRPEIAVLAADPSVLTGAASFARAALAAGDLNTARAWRAKADRTRSDVRVLAAIDAAAAAGGFAAGEDARFAAERRADAGGPSARRDVLALVALGLPAQGGAEALTAPVTPPPANPRASANPRAAERELRLAQLAEARSRQASGEVALLAGLLLSDGAQTLSADDLSAVITALSAAGFTEDARAAAMEAILSITPAAPSSSAATPRPPARPNPR